VALRTSPPCPAIRISLRERLLANLVGTARDVMTRWYLYLPFFAIWVLAGARVLSDPTPLIPLLFNWTPSLPYHVAWLSRGDTTNLKRGEFVLFRFNGSAGADYRGLQDQPFFKIIKGVPGDVVSVESRVVRVNGEVVGVAKERTFDRRKLDPIAAGPIANGHYYVQGTSHDSFDSRYAQSGLVSDDRIIGRVRPLF
jgi:conjugal transfer pilin signal peptidase TrbI